jgi:hypothetical protein
MADDDDDAQRWAEEIIVVNSIIKQVASSG